MGGKGERGGGRRSYDGNNGKIRVNIITRTNCIPRSFVVSSIHLRNFGSVTNADVDNLNCIREGDRK
jgi:hypothetical protein